MPSEVICPTCGRSLIVDLEDEPNPPDTPPTAARTIEVVIPGTCTSFDDFDGPSISMASPDPDPILGCFVYGDTTPLTPSARFQGDGHGRRIPDQARADPLANLNFEQSPAPRSDSVADENDAVEYEESQGPGWPMILLASYASAMTVACLWLVWIGRTRERVEVIPPTIPADSRPDLSQPARSAATIVPVAPIAADRLTSLGQTIRLGDIEFTPLSLRAGRVSLEHLPVGSDSEQGDGGTDALQLRVRFHNLSRDTAFAPLEAAYVREPDRGLPESFIETGAGERIEIYRLAIQSEWAIVGQTFPELKPDETAETMLVSVADALGNLSNPMTWRIRLRTGPDQTDLAGVRFGIHEIVRDGD